MVESSSSSPSISKSIAPRKRHRQSRSGRRETEIERQLIYTRKFIERVRRLRRVVSADATAHAVRDAADRVLVEFARGKTHWSRAMLKRRLMRRNTRPKPMIRKNKPAPPKARVLRRLVPGCRKLSLPKLLEETADYIGALEMQVKAMALLNALVNGAVPAAT